LLRFKGCSRDIYSWRGVKWSFFNDVTSILTLLLIYGLSLQTYVMWSTTIFIKVCFILYTDHIYVIKTCLFEQWSKMTQFCWIIIFGRPGMNCFIWNVIYRRSLTIGVLNLFCSVYPLKAKNFPRNPKISLNPCKRRGLNGYNTLNLWLSWTTLWGPLTYVLPGLEDCHRLSPFRNLNIQLNSDDWRHFAISGIQPDFPERKFDSDRKSVPDFPS